MRLEKPLIDPPAISGGTVLFPKGLPLTRPVTPDLDETIEDFRKILGGSTLTNGPFVSRLEKEAAEYFGVRHCVAVSSCTSGLMLLLKAGGVLGDVIVPSFTFAATVHAIVWNGLRPVFADIDPETLTLSPEAVQRAAGLRTSAILATHIYGNPCDVSGLTAVAKKNGLRLFFDAAHAFGSKRAGVAVGAFGDAEVFSLSPTKLVVSGEGGIIATNDEDLARRLRMGRDYGNPGDYDCLFVGLNARMSEFHAALGLRSLEVLEEAVAQRNRLAGHYRTALEKVPGISFPKVRAIDRSTFKDFTILVDAEHFGGSADDLAEALKSEGVETRRYYSPAVHKMRAYRGFSTNGNLSVTDSVVPRVLTLPMFAEMTHEDVQGVAKAIRRIQRSFAGVQVWDPNPFVVPDVEEAAAER